MVKLLVESGADVNKAAANQETPIHMACENRDLSIVKALVNADSVSKRVYGEALRSKHYNLDNNEGELLHSNSRTSTMAPEVLQRLQVAAEQSQTALWSVRDVFIQIGSTCSGNLMLCHYEAAKLNSLLTGQLT